MTRKKGLQRQADCIFPQGTFINDLYLGKCRPINFLSKKSDLLMKLLYLLVKTVDKYSYKNKTKIIFRSGNSGFFFTEWTTQMFT